MATSFAVLVARREHSADWRGVDLCSKMGYATWYMALGGTTR